jgi:hypothetical protein
VSDGGGGSGRGGLEEFAACEREGIHVRNVTRMIGCFGKTV